MTYCWWLKFGKVFQSRFFGGKWFEKNDDTKCRISELVISSRSFVFKYRKGVELPEGVGTSGESP